MQPLVVIVVQGGVVQYVKAPPGVHYRIVDWDNLEAEGIECPRCGATDLTADLTTLDDWFTCDNCDYRFNWSEQDEEHA